MLSIKFTRRKNHSVKKNTKESNYKKAKLILLTQNTTKQHQDKCYTFGKSLNVKVHKKKNEKQHGFVYYFNNIYFFELF
jgi:hypothetical protein